MKNIFKITIIAYILVFSSMQAKAQNGAIKTDSLPSISRSAISLTPQNVLINGLRLDFEKSLRHKRKEGFALVGQSLVFAPHLYRSRYRIDKHGDNRRMVGAGLDLYHKLYVVEDDGGGIEAFVGYGLGASYIRASYDDTEFILKESPDGLVYYVEEKITRRQQLLRPNMFLLAGLQLKLTKAFRVELFGGAGNREVLFLNKPKDKSYFTNDIFEPAFDGFYLLAGMRVGILLNQK